MVALQPLGKHAFVDAGVPILQLSGREWAPMTTGRVMRAAQVYFGFPVKASDGEVRAGRQRVANDELRNVVQHKNFDVFEDGDSGLVRMVYRELVLRFLPDVTASQRRAFLQRNALTVQRANAFNGRQVVARGAERVNGAELVALALELGIQPEVEFSTPNFVSQYRRSLVQPSAPTPSAAQWHLRLVRAKQAWAHGLGSRRITVAVLDDGVDVDHVELRPNLQRNPDPQDPSDLLGRDFFVPDDVPDHYDPRPKRFRMPFGEMTGNDIHGTPCAGVAVGTGPRGYGMAPRCRLLPVKIFHADDLAADERVADAIRYAGAFADVLSCSWSGSPSPDISAAIADVSTTGRKGRGAIVVCATGNDGQENVGFPASDVNSIGVGASTDQDVLADYSNRGDAVWVVAPSSGGTKGIFATDVALPGRGFNTGEVGLGGKDGLFTNDFGGTSSATPLVAGLVALMLSADPKMTPADVKAHLAGSAVKLGSEDLYDASGRSKEYGHGRIDAAAALASVNKALVPAKKVKPAAKKSANSVPVASKKKSGKKAIVRAEA